MATTRYLWNDVTDTVMMEKDGQGNTTAAYNTDPSGRLRSVCRGGKTYNYHFDGRGNTTCLTDQTGKKTDTYTYDAFGNQRTHTGTTKNPYRFGGQFGYQYNEATDDYYVRARPYEPKQGRWPSKDPLRFADGLNPYVYVGNGPTNAVDPTGLLTKAECEACVTKGPKADGVIQAIYGNFLKKGLFFRRDCKPSISCEDCRNPLDRGALKIGTQMIRLCYKRFIDASRLPGSKFDKCEDLWETLRHELWHLVDQCRRFDTVIKKTKCERCICDELRAFTVSKQCAPTSIWYTSNKFKSVEECLGLSSAESCKSQCISLTKAKTKKQHLDTIREVLPKCAPPGKTKPEPPKKRKISCIPCRRCNLT